MGRRLGRPTCPGSKAGVCQLGPSRLVFQPVNMTAIHSTVCCREQDRFLPIANISRIMKKNLPGNAKIAKDAKETVQECVSEFISFITSE